MKEKHTMRSAQKPMFDLLRDQPSRAAIAESPRQGIGWEAPSLPRFNVLTTGELKDWFRFADKRYGGKMKIFEIVPAKVVSSRGIRQPKRVEFRIASRRSLLRRFERFIESTDWDGRYLCSRRIDKACIGVLVFFMFYFVPVLAPIFLR